ncbi:cache domain-containing protein [Cohnella soli]|uniref:histidine kinase n=1 Tax=Cohnella soli TaxID=425005 RepID=A0ABW0HXQ8_9BACL
MKKLLNSLLNYSRNIGIIKKFILFYLITIFIPVIIIYYVSYTNTVNLIQREIQTSLSSLSVQVNNNLEDWLKKMDSMTSTMYTSALLNTLSKEKYETDSLEFVNDHREFDKFFMYVLTQSNEIASIYVFTQNKNMFYKSYAGSVKLHYDPEGEEWYSRTLNNKGKTTFFGLHDPWPLSSGKGNVFSFSREIRNMEGEHLGVLLVDIKLNSISQLISRSADTYNSKFLVMDNNGNLVYHDKEIEFANDENALAKLNHSDTQPSTTVINGKTFHLTSQTSDISGWKIISVTPEQSFNQHTLKLFVFYAIITAISVFVFSFMLLLLYLTIYRPIYRLNHSMKKVEAGDFSVQMRGLAKDEIGQLNTSFNQMVVKVKDLIESEYKATILRKDAELKALQAQINPHFLYNTLQLISSIAVVKKIPEINRASLSLGYMLRYSIQSSGDLVPFKQELEHVTSYLAIQKIRLEDEVSINVDVGHGVEELEIMKLTLQPIVENAFQHGIDKRRVHGIVELKAEAVNDQLIISIRDNGIGMSEETLRNLMTSLESSVDHLPNNGKENIGLSNVYSRLKLHYGAKCAIRISSQYGEGTEVIITVPAIKHQGEKHHV